MIPSKQKVLEILKDVVYFPKGSNIVDAEMVKDVEVGENLVRFKLVLDDVDDEKNKFVIENAKKILNDNFGDVDVDIIPTAPITMLSKVKHIIAVASGKGGVGKSTVAVNLAVALAVQGFKVGMLDADIYGPSVPIMFGTEGEQPECYDKDGKTYMVPLQKYGIKLMSIGMMVNAETPLIWRGPMATSALTQLMTETDWGEIDFLVVDMPPGTGDIQLCLAQNFKVAGSIIVTTPQKVAFADVRRAANMFKHKGVSIPILGLVENMAYFTPSDMPDKKYYIFGQGHGKEFAEELGIPILGLVENMAYFTPSDMPDKKYYIFGQGHGKEFAEELGIPFLGAIPMDENIASAGDKGTPYTFGNFGPVTAAFEKVARRVIELV